MTTTSTRLPEVSDPTKVLMESLAINAWASATPNQKAGIRFGLFDVELFRAAGLDPHTVSASDLRNFTLTLLACAAADGGMRA